MAADDLTRPLGKDSTTRLPRDSFPFRWLAGGVLAAVALSAGYFLVMVDDPHGGEPVAVVALEANPPAEVDPGTVAAIAAAPGGTGTADPSGIRISAAPPEISPHEIVIRDATSGGAVSLFTEPVDGLLERGPHGLIPRVGASGIRPFDAYKRPEDTGRGMAQGRIAVVVTGLGLDAEGTAAAVGKLPGEMTLAFAPHGEDLDRWVTRARDAGHEVLLQLAGEMMIADASAEENMDRLYWLMSRITTYAGVVGSLDPEFAADEAALTPVMAEISTRGLLYLDDGKLADSLAADLAEGRTPLARADVTIDASAGPQAIEQQLQALEQMARQRGFAIGAVEGLTLTVDLLAAWAARLQERGIDLVPVSALARG